MTTVLLFHHAQGLTNGVRWFADQLRAAGHQVLLPDLYDGATFADLDAGVAHAEQVGFDTLTRQGIAQPLTYPPVPWSPASRLEPSRLRPSRRPAGIRGAVTYAGGVPSSAFGGPWPAEVALEVHLSAEDGWSELEVAETLVAEATDGTLHVHPGSGHLICDSSLPDFDPQATSLILDRTAKFLDRMSFSS